VGGFRSALSRKLNGNYACRKLFGCLFGRGFESLRFHKKTPKFRVILEFGGFFWGEKVEGGGLRFKVLGSRFKVLG